MLAFLGFFNLGPQELIPILIIVILLFGSKKLPQLARSIGESLKEFKKVSKENDDDDVQEIEEGKEVKDK